jgi:hypothetical protein
VLVFEQDSWTTARGTICDELGHFVVSSIVCGAASASSYFTMFLGNLVGNPATGKVIPNGVIAVCCLHRWDPGKRGAPNLGTNPAARPIGSPWEREMGL